MVSITTFGPGDLGSDPGWFTVLNSNRTFISSQIIQAGGTLASTVTLQWVHPCR